MMMMMRSTFTIRFLVLLTLCVGTCWLLSCRKSPTSPPATQNSAPHARSSTQPFIPSDPQLIADNNSGVGLMGKFEYEPARAVFQRLCDQHPDWSDVQVNLAIATLNRQREGDEQAALEILNRVLSNDPNHIRANYCSGLLKLYLQSADDALTHFQRVASADDKDAYAAYYIGQCLTQNHNYAEAVTWYTKAIALDPYLRSAYYAASQAYRGAGKNDDAAQMLEQFQKLEKNPRAHQVKFAYSLMGPKANAQTVDLPAARRIVPPKPQGPIFLDPVPLLDDGDQYKWAVQKTNRPVSITACDINGDGQIDVFIANVLDQGDLHNAVCINQGNGRFKLDAEHPLAKIPNVNAALWGDYDNDGLKDVYLCRHGPNQLWRQIAMDKWQDVTESAGTADGNYDTVDGALFDADHDGDLDIFCVNADGPNELLNNNLDGTFRPIAKEKGIAGSGKGSRQVLPVDLDSDRDLDIIVINNEPPHDVWMNDRLWEYHRSTEPAALIASNARGIITVDESGAQTELVAALDNGVMYLQQMVPDHWNTLVVEPDHPEETRASQIADLDVYGNGIPKVVAPDGLHGFPRTVDEARQMGSTLRGWSPILLHPHEGFSVIATLDGKAPLIWRPGPGRYPFAALSFTGKKQGDTMRSNASGIGTHYAARIDSNWVVGDMLRNSSGPGQSLQPVAIGLGGQSQIDFVAIDWSDGVFQTEVDFKAGELHPIAETQRQLSSCPVLFAWNGKKYAFIADLLGVGGIGYATGPGEYAPSRPWEHLLLPQDALQTKDGRYVLKFSEPMEEACYLDAARLVAYDLPPGWNMTVDDRMNVMGPEPTGETRFYHTTLLPVKAVNDRGEDVTSDIITEDLRATPPGEVDSRFIGRLQHDHVLNLKFNQAIDSTRSGTPPMLIIDGWIEYPYSQTMFAAWQAHAEYRSPTIESRGDDGQWRTIMAQFGYPAGMPRQMSVPLLNLPAGATQLRISTNMEIYWDRIAIAFADPAPQVVRHDLKVLDAKLIQSGFAQRTTGPQRQPYYDYDHRAPLWDTRHQSGFYTQFGSCTELVQAKDDALAIFGPGEEIQMEFDAALPALPAGWTRRFLLETDGWCKDMDLYTKDGDTLEPLPRSGPQENPARDQLHQRFNTRYESGR